MKKLAILFASMFLLSICTANASLISPMDTPLSVMGVSSEFSDVNSSTSYSDSIDWLKNNDIVSGYKDGSFGIDECVNRVEFLKIMYKVQDLTILTASENGKDLLFKDVPANAWYTPYVKIAKEQGIVKGYPDNTFHPTQCITRAEGAKIAALSFNNNVMPKNPESDYYFYSASNYGDIKEGSWYYSYMDYALKSNTVGTDHTWGSYDYDAGLNKFLPNDPMTRKEAAEMFFRFKAMTDNKADKYDYQNPIIKEAKRFYNNCTNDLSLPEGLDIEINADILSALPQDSSIVIGADHSNDSQLKNIDKILSTLTKQDFWKDASAELTQLEIFTEGSWKMAMGVSMDNPSDPNPEAVIVAKFDKDAEFESFIKDLASEEMNYSLTCKNSGGITYWTSTKEEFYFAKLDKFFIVTNTDASRKQTIERLTNGGGFAFDNNFNNGKLAYLYINENFMETVKEELQGEMDPLLSQLTGTLSSIGDVYAYVKSDNEGFLTSLEAKVTNSNDPFIKSYIGSSASLVDKVPGKNTLIYAEDLDLSLVLQAMVGFSSSFIASELGTTEKEIENLFSSPYAFSIADNGSFLPSMSFYLQLEAGDRSTADKVVEALTKAIDSEMTSSEVKTTRSTTASGLNKITLDIDSIPTTSDEEVKMKNSLKESGVEFYYGVLSDNTLVIALYPNFEQDYGTATLSQDSTYNQAVKKLNGVYGSKVSYVNITNLAEYLENIMFLFGDESFIMPSEKEMESIKDIVGMFKYVISSTKVTKTSVMINSYLRMGN